MTGSYFLCNIIVRNFLLNLTRKHYICHQLRLSINYWCAACKDLYSCMLWLCVIELHLLITASEQSKRFFGRRTRLSHKKHFTNNKQQSIMCRLNVCMSGYSPLNVLKVTRTRSRFSNKQPDLTHNFFQRCFQFCIFWNFSVLQQIITVPAQTEQRKNLLSIICKKRTLCIKSEVSA